LLPSQKLLVFRSPCISSFHMYPHVFD
jgi:hypothetical protein